jgi:replication-associated recombination protein RarA
MSLFDGMQGIRAIRAQADLGFPASLAEEYRPRLMSDFVGLAKAKRILSKFANAPYSSAWLFLGSSGTGKSSMAIAFCEAVRGELHHIPSQQCSVENIDSVVRQCHYMPSTGKSFHVGFGG